MKGKRVVIAMSGGVDSSVSAALLVEAGYDVTGVSMQLYDPPPDLTDARRVAQQLGIPHETLDLRRQFRQIIIDYFVGEYGAGRTPNPCVRCNERFKFGLLLERALAMGGDYLATGHYARVIADRGGIIWLTAGDDPSKDQSYFLFALPQATIRRVIFPVGELTKGRVREIARERGLPVAQKSESQEVCFIPDNDYVRFIQQRGGGLPPGDIALPDGTVIGRHEGLHRYTVGQRRGLGIAWSHPLHVVRLEPAVNRLIVGPRELLAGRGLAASGGVWNIPPEKEFRASCRIRYRHHPSPCLVTIGDGGAFTVIFDEPQYAITPGQAAVIYDGDRVLGGGWIDSPLPA